ncbi:OLD family protein [Helicobacter bizzozeronii]|uniref:hypothetical protein n=1 Tax=Helicobacter bizzozeronii TaxID=56877 RepID=UPI0013154E76|nr:hypothetical protein [Helicobacter bizzozeronii]
MNHLDEVRMVVKNTRDGTKGSWIDNDFSVLKSKKDKEGKKDKVTGGSVTLRKIFEALGVSKLNLRDNRVIFVEGITDHNIFGTYQKIYRENKTQFIFIPIGGLGESNNSNFSEAQQDKIDDLHNFAQQIGIDRPLLLVDYDEAGRAVKEGVTKIKEEATNKPKFPVDIITLKDAFIDDEGNPRAGFGELYSKEDIELETLFIEKDRKKFGLQIGLQNYKKLHMASMVSSAFKNNLRKGDEGYGLDQKTQDNFNALFEFLEKKIGQQIQTNSCEILATITKIEQRDRNKAEELVQELNKLRHLAQSELEKINTDTAK